MTKKQKVYLPLKRVIDFSLSMIALILVSPLLLLITIIIKVDSKGPVLFKQKRIGINNSVFEIIKFRTMEMSAPKDSPTDELSNPDSWITKSGNVLRKTSLDELPQLVNIIKGEMSIVGPRPALWNQVNLNTLRNEANVNLIKPGLTGLAQVNGRDENNDEEKVFWDKEYLKRFSLMFDMYCIFKTITAVFGSKGVVEGGVKNVEENINNR